MFTKLNNDRPTILVHIPLIASQINLLITHSIPRTLHGVRIVKTAIVWTQVGCSGFPAFSPSTLSSATNSMAAIVWQDLLEDHLNQLTQARLTLINKIMGKSQRWQQVICCKAKSSHFLASPSQVTSHFLASPSQVTSHLVRRQVKSSHKSFGPNTSQVTSLFVQVQVK